jgi:hypothetical protein
MEKVMHTTRRLQKKLCTQLVVREKNIHTSYSSSSYAHKLYTQVLLESNFKLKNYLTNFISRSYAPKLCVTSYAILKIEIRGKKKLSRKEKLGRGGTGRWEGSSLQDTQEKSFEEAKCCHYYS